MLRRAALGLLAAFLLLPGGPSRGADEAAACAVPPAADWRDGERWAWSEICQGRTADFAQHFGGGVDPAAADGWPAERTITAGFLADILQRHPWREALTPRGVRLGGVRLAGPLDLTNATVPVELRLEGSLIGEPLVLAGAHDANQLSFDDSRFTATLDLSRLDLAGGLTLRRARVADLSLAGARIGDDADLADLAASGAVSLEAGRVAGLLTLSRLRVGRLLDLHGLAVARDVALDHADLATARLDDLQVGG